MPNAGLTESGCELWVYMPGHSWRARKRAELFAAKQGLTLTDEAGSRRIMSISPDHRQPGLYEVFTFKVAPRREG